MDNGGHVRNNLAPRSAAAIKRGGADDDEATIAETYGCHASAVARGIRDLSVRKPQARVLPPGQHYASAVATTVAVGDSR